jgi:hypothetical protein
MDKFSEHNFRAGDIVRVRWPGTSQRGLWKVKKLMNDGYGVKIAKLDEFGGETGIEATFVPEGLCLERER